ncbi:radical SAM protein [Luedemannella flava]
MRILTRAELALRGVRVDSLRRPDGAGPSGDDHVLVDGANAALPTNPSSPYSVRDGRVWLGDEDTGLTLTPVRRPRFYDLTTADGVPYEKIARLHGADVLATTVVQTCIRYAEADRCRFCTIEEALASGSTVAAKTPEQLAEVAEAAVRLDGVRQMVLTTGTTTGPDRGARTLARSVRAIRAAVPDLPVQVQCEPRPTSPGSASCTWPAPPRSASTSRASTTGCAAPGCRARPRSRWPATTRPGTRPYASSAATASPRTCWWGSARTPTSWSPGRAGSSTGVYPFVVPFRPMRGTLAARDGVGAPDPAVLAYVTERVAARLRAAGMSGADQQAGCAACGACSVLRPAGG